MLEAGDEPPGVNDEARVRAAVWEVLVTVSVFAWVILAGIGWRLAREVRELSGRPADVWPVIAFVVTVYVAVALPLILAALLDITNDKVLAGQQLKNFFLHLAGVVLIAPLLIAIKRLQQFAEDDSAWSLTVETIADVTELRRALNLATAALGGIVASAVVATGALRDAVAAAGFDTTPDTFVLVYGAWYTAVLGGIYYYAFAAIEERAEWFLERTAPLPQPSLDAAEEFSTAVDLREQLTQELELGRSAFANLEGLVVILSPLLGAVLTRLAGV